MGISLKRFTFTQEENPIQAWSMKEDHICILNMALSFFHVRLDMFLKQFLILSSHLGTYTGHDIGSMVFIDLSATLLLTGNVFGIRFSEDDFSSFVDLDEELASMTKNQNPEHIGAFPENSQRIKCFIVSMFGNSL